MTDRNIQVTPRQNEYLLALEDGPKVTRDLVLSFEVTGQSVGKIIHKLRDLGLVVSSAGHIPQHALVRSYPELVADGLVVCNRKLHCYIPDEEVKYVAQLRKDGWVGQRLIDRYLVRFPSSSEGGVRYRVNKARARGLF
jgi:hypothetical protein